MINENNQPMVFQKEVKEILDILFDFQNKGLGTVFFEVSGHCQSVNVRIHTPGWKENRSADFDKYIYIDEQRDVQSVLNLKISLLKFIHSVPIVEQDVVDMIENSGSNREPDWHLKY